MNMEKAACSGSLNPQHGWSVEGDVLEYYSFYSIVDLRLDVFYYFYHTPCLHVVFESMCSTFSPSEKSRLPFVTSL